MGNIHLRACLLGIFLAGAFLPAVELPDYTSVISPGTVKPFVDGDRIAFLGDSITCGGSYHKFIYTYWVTRHPDITITVRNKGIFSDFVPGGVARLDFDVLKEKPNRIAIDYGMNDSGASYRADLFGMEHPSAEVEQKRRDTVAKFRTEMERLLSILQERRITPLLIGPSLYDNTMEREGLNRLGANSGIQACVQELRDLAGSGSYDFVDFNRPMLLANIVLQQSDPKSTIVGGDRVHPDKPGHWLMAYVFLKAQNASPYVAKVSVDALAGTVASAENCAATGLKTVRDGIGFDYLPNSLPLPFNEEYQKSAGIVPLTEGLNREIFQVTGLPAGSYVLTIDGQGVGTSTAEDFAQGINVALAEHNPGQIQAKRLDALIQERSGLEGRIRMLRQVDCGLAKRFLAGERPQIIAEFRQKLAKATLAEKTSDINSLTTYLKDIEQEDAIDRRISDLESQIYQDNKPSQHRVIIEAVGNQDRK